VIDRIAPTRRPEGPPQGYHKWRSLLFIHWEVPEAILRPLVPKGLTIDTFEGKAYVGLVCFTMMGIRPTRFLPPIPGLAAFHETNVRTYVHRDGKDPGVWFMSLDAANSVAVKAARSFWHLPYFRADMTLSHDGTKVHYRSSRRWPPPVPAATEVKCTVGAPIGTSEPDTLQFFLAERYFLYCEKNGRILSGRVHHAPYPLNEVQVDQLDETVVAAGGVTERGARTKDYWSSGVDVEVFSLS
jgi:hypothetical protein